MYDFEFDPDKSAANRQKHGIDFVEAQAIWNDPFRLEVPTKSKDEDRFLIIGILNGRLWSAIVTYRHEKIRLISVRRARDEEREIYENI